MTHSSKILALAYTGCLLTALFVFAITHECVGTFVQVGEITNQIASQSSSKPGVNPANTWEPPHITLTNVAAADHPVWIANAGDSSDRLFVVEESGTIKIINKNTPFLSLQSGQVKMVSVAFSPKYPSNGLFYVSYYDSNSVFRISRFTVSQNPDLADVGSQTTIGTGYSVGCNGGQLIFANDGTLFLNLAGPVLDPGYENAPAGKMMALLNEANMPLPTTTGTNWLFSNFFAATDCSEIGGSFAGGSGPRMDGVYFYADSNGAICGLKLNGTEWVKYRLANPTAIMTGSPSVELTSGNGGQSAATLSAAPKIVLRKSSMTAIRPVATITSNGAVVVAARGNTPSQRTSSADFSAVSANISMAPHILEAAVPATVHPFIISAFGRDEKGRVYVANYGTPRWQRPPAGTKTDEGAIYLIQDDLLQFEVRKVVHDNHVTLAWQSAPGIKYRIQMAGESSHWTDIRPEMTGTGQVLSVADLPNNARIFYRVIAVTPIKT